MQLKNFIQELENKGITYKLNEPMQKHTTFRIGGNADLFITVSSVEELQAVIIGANKNSVPVFVIGRGSNLLVSDKGIEGAVISLAGMNSIDVRENTITADAGVPLSALCVAARDAGLSGLEFAYGIPGSVGGAMYMNAGAYGGEMSQVAVCADCIDRNGNVSEISADDMKLGYRTSAFKKNGLYILSVTIKLIPKEKNLITAQMEKHSSARKEKQPLEYPSAGSTFKRPNGYFAGALIENNGLKGTSVGGAQVSEKHAGFVINKGNATCQDVCRLIEKIKTCVFENDGVKLETEVMFIGRK